MSSTDPGSFMERTVAPLSQAQVDVWNDHIKIIQIFAACGLTVQVCTLVTLTGTGMGPADVRQRCGTG